MKYSNYNSFFSAENAAVLSENFRINEHAIELEENKKSFFGFIYNLGPVKLENLKIYININLAFNFIRSSKSPAKALILFIQKLDRNFQLYMNYRGLNNNTIKNQCSLSLIGKLLNQLG